MASQPLPQTSPIEPPAVDVPGKDAPVRKLKTAELQALGQTLNNTFTQYASDRNSAEQKWLRNLRQYLGIYDPEVEKQLSVNRSKAYPRITRVKCISVLSRIMNLMFPGNERNWSITASPSADMSPEDVEVAVQKVIAKNKEAGVEIALDEELVQNAVQNLATERATALSLLIDDQLQEIGGDQTADYVQLNRKVAKSGIEYGLGVLRGPFVRETKKTVWSIAQSGRPTVRTETVYKPQYEFVPVWDFYPDMAAKSLAAMDGYFLRIVMSKSQVRKLADRNDFFGDIIKTYLKGQGQTGNYKARGFESELRSMGVKDIVNDQKPDALKYEIICWHGPVSAEKLVECGVEIPDSKRADDVEAEVWMIDGHVIKADMNPWAKIGVDVRTIHTFLFDEDDTSPVGNGLPNVVRDSAMSCAAATRMLLDNASVVCGPNIEVNMDLMVPNQDVSSVTAYKVWYREGMGAEAQYPAVRGVAIDGHMTELMAIVDMFLKFADMETFVGPATGGDMAAGASEPMRTAAGASMMRGDAALPFKDIVRNFDAFTQSLIQSVVVFNKKFNPKSAPAGDYNVIARGASSLIAKEVRGMQIDTLSQGLRPGEEVHVDDRKMIEAKFAVRDMSDMLVPADEARRRQKANSDAQAKALQAQEELNSANVRKLLTDALKNVAQAEKNSVGADAVKIQSAVKILQEGIKVDEAEAGPPAGAS